MTPASYSRKNSVGYGRGTSYGPASSYGRFSSRRQSVVSGLAGTTVSGVSDHTGGASSKSTRTNAMDSGIGAGDASTTSKRGKRGFRRQQTFQEKLHDRRAAFDV